MSSKRKKLGTLADIFQAENLDGAISRIRLDRIRPSEDQPRKDRTVAIDELATSIARDGLLSPLVVTKEDGGFRIIAGERRYHALKRLGHADAECRIISREEHDYWRISIIENLQRENLSSEEEAIALWKLKKQENYSDAELASLVGKSRNYITEILGIASLPETVLTECRRAGIDNKNMLIQAVQAHKKGNFREFLNAWQEGNIRTVRGARDFIQERGEKSDRKNPEQKSEGSDPVRFSVKISGNTVMIECSGPAEARRVAAWIKSGYPKKD